MFWFGSILGFMVGAAFWFLWILWCVVIWNRKAKVGKCPLCERSPI
jgi:hypothetical protein